MTATLFKSAFREEDHPRDEAGRFGSGGGGDKPTPAPSKERAALDRARATAGKEPVDTSALSSAASDLRSGDAAEFKATGTGDQIRDHFKTVADDLQAAMGGYDGPAKRVRDLAEKLATVVEERAERADAAAAELSSANKALTAHVAAEPEESDVPEPPEEFEPDPDATDEENAAAEAEYDAAVSAWEADVAKIEAADEKDRDEWEAEKESLENRRADALDEFESAMGAFEFRLEDAQEQLAAKLADGLDKAEEWLDEADEEEEDKPNAKDWNESQHPRDTSGRFGSGGAGGGPEKPRRGVLARAGDALKRARGILAAAADVPKEAVKKAKKLGKAAMDRIEKRYGKGVKRAVAAAVLVSLPLPVPGMSVLISAPIIAFAELHRQLLGGKAAEGIDPELVKRLARRVLKKLFGGTVPAEVDMAALDGEREPEKDMAFSESRRWEVFAKRHPGTKEAAAAVSDETKFDDVKMTADAVLSNGIVDRDGEIMLPSGCDLTDYQAYAPWFFGHQKVPQFALPIGAAKERPLERDCPLDVTITGDRIVGRCWFHQHTPEAETIYRLWRDGILRAVSVGFDGITPEVIRGKEALALSGGRYDVINRWTKWKMVENSVVGLGANREALALHAARGVIGKQAIPESLRPWFAQFKPAVKLFRSGFEKPVPAIVKGFGAGFGRVRV